jgi:hypothetical protein
MADILVEGGFYMGTSSACVIDLTPPTFLGINFLDVESRGQIRAGWSAATDPNAPIRYEIYIQASTATGLFNTANITAITDKLQFDIFTMPDGSFLVNGTTYYVGVRALDSLSNRDANTVSLNVISTGVLTSIDVFQSEAVFSVDEEGKLRGSLWANKNESLAKSPNAVMGTASYQIYDRLGNAVVGMNQSGIIINGQGIYITSPIVNTLDEDFNNYVAKVTVSVDGEDRTNYVAMRDVQPIYSLDGVCSIDNLNNLVGSFWAINNEQIVTNNLGTGSYQAFMPDGTLIPGLSESGITADVNGFFSITPFPLPPTLDTTLDYIVKISIDVNGVIREKNVVLLASPVTYTPKATFSINALNQLEATFWATQNEQLADVSILGDASYQIYDKLGNVVVGLSEASISPDVNGLYHTTPISATLITDLTHYSAKITIEIAGKDRVSVKGFTLLGT